MRTRSVLLIMLAPWAALMGAVVMLLAFMAFVTAFLAPLVAMAAAVTAYVKRDEWTLPAYRWARERTGRWRVTPWSSDGEAARVAKEEQAA